MHNTLLPNGGGSFQFYKKFLLFAQGKAWNQLHKMKLDSILKKTFPGEIQTIAEPKL